MEVGHCAQNIHLEAIALGLESVPIGAFEDVRVKQVLDLQCNINTKKRKDRVESLYPTIEEYLERHEK